MHQTPIQTSVGASDATEQLGEGDIKDGQADCVIDIKHWNLVDSCIHHVYICE
jgi:hypothetical protein